MAIDPILKIPYSRAAFLWNCGADGLPSDSFCCGSYANPARSCCASAFAFTGSGLAFKPGRDLELQQLSSATSATPSSASTTAAASSATGSATGGSGETRSGTNLALAVGAGVGIPLGVLAVGILGFLVWREKNKKHVQATKELPTETYDHAPPHQHHAVLQPQSDLIDRVKVHEIDGMAKK